MMMVVIAMVMIKCSGLKKKKEKQKAQGKGDINRSFLVWRSRHLASVTTFRIDSCTIKRGETRREMRLSKCY
jgi:hypothetical protein